MSLIHTLPNGCKSIRLSKNYILMFYHTTIGLCSNKTKKTWLIQVSAKDPWYKPRFEPRHTPGMALAGWLFFYAGVIDHEKAYAGRPKPE